MEATQSLVAQTLYTPEVLWNARRRAKALSGEILAMSGASLAHTRITLDIATELNIQLRGQKCEVVTNDMRVKTIRFLFLSGCRCILRRKFEDETFDTLLNPVSTEAYDRGEKFECILKRNPRFTR